MTLNITTIMRIKKYIHGNFAGRDAAFVRVSGCGSR